jgi:hypothetical protein
VTPGGIGLCVDSGLTVISLAAVAAALAMYRRGALPGAVVLVLAAGLSSGAWAVIGWYWLLSGARVT